MLVKKSDAQEFTIPGGTTGVLYPPSPKGDQSVAVVELDGEYPQKGWSINNVCTETLYVLEGELQLTIRHMDEVGSPDIRWRGGRDTSAAAGDGGRSDLGHTYSLQPGDLFMILPRNNYRLTGKGKTCVFITPAWDSNQNHILYE